MWLVARVVCGCTSESAYYRRRPIYPQQQEKSVSLGSKVNSLGKQRSVKSSSCGESQKTKDSLIGHTHTRHCVLCLSVFIEIAGDVSTLRKSRDRTCERRR